MKPISRFALRACQVATLSLAPLACTQTAQQAASNPPPAPAAAQAPSEARVAERGPDPADALLAEAETLPLHNDQVLAVRSLKQELDRNRAKTHAAFAAVRTELAREVRAGAIDTAELRAEAEKAAEALHHHVDEEASVLDELHGVLGKADRSSLVASVRNDQGVRLTAAEIPKARGDRFARLTRMLDLDGDQQRAVAGFVNAEPRAAAAPTDDPDARMARVLDGFASEGFDAQTALAPNGALPADEVRDGFERKADFLAKLVPILRPDQREKLAAHIESER